MGRDGWIRWGGLGWGWLEDDVGGAGVVGDGWR